MPENKVLDEVTSKTMGFSARHPRLIASLVMLLVLIALSGGAAAEMDAGTFEGGDVNDGP